MICLISFRKFPEVLPAFTCAKAIGNIQNICLEVSILSPRMSSLHHMQLMYHFEIVLIKFNNLLLRVAKFRKNFLLYLAIRLICYLLLLHYLIWFHLILLLNPIWFPSTSSNLILSNFISLKRVSTSV